MRYMTSLRPNKRIALLYASGILLLVLAFVFGTLSGSTEISLSQLADAISKGDGTVFRILKYVRFPRTAGAVVCGAALSVSGAVIQSVLANSLASPSVIGVNAGAGLAVTVCTAVGIYGGWQMAACAFVGAVTAVMLVGIASRKWGASRGTVILIGIAMNSLLGAISDAIVTFVPEIGVMSRDFKLGDLSAVTYGKLIPSAVVLIAVTALILTLSRELSVLSLGEDRARSLGLDTTLVRVIFLILAALLAGAAVSIAGLLSFVGLMVPHTVRRLMGIGGNHLIPLCALFGGGFVAVCDTVARTVFAPYEIPVGIIMAFIGAPFFVFILIKGKGGTADDKLS